MKRSFRPALRAGIVLLGLSQLCIPHASANQAPLAADILVVIDESGSMSGEQRWLGDMAPLLEDNLKQYGIGSESQSNTYGLVGFGNSSVVPRTLAVGGEKLGSVAAFVEASKRLIVSGGTEDGWRGIEYALDEYPRRNGAAVNVILATDEDRDNTRSSVTYQTVREKLEDNRALLNAVVNARFYCSDNTRALGMDSLGTGYVADGSGGFTLCEGASARSGSGRTIAHYVDLAMENGGAAWDLNFLRSGGTNAESFTKALLDIKVEEILAQRPTGDLVAVVQATPNPAVAGEVVTLDGTGSFHQKEGRSIVRWEWDLDNDGAFDATGPVITTSFPELGQYPVSLRVTDDSETPLLATALVTVSVDTPPLEPTADAGGPYLFCPQNQPWFVDGSGSVNPDDGLSETGQPEDRIIGWDWNLDNDLGFDDGSGERIDVTDQFANRGPGDYLVRLKVTDNTRNAFPSSGRENLTDTSVTQVRIRDEADAACNRLTDFAARAKMTKVQLIWSDSGAPSYGIFRSEQAGGPYERIATTDSRYSTYLDLGRELDTTYFYVVSELGTNGQPTSRSREVSVTPTARRLNARNRPPAITSSPVITASEDVPYEYTVTAVDPDPRDRIEYSLQVAPTGMVIDAASGAIEWTPVNAQVGSQTVIVQVSDSQGEFVEQVFSIQVANVNQPPRIVSSPETQAVELESYRYQIEAVDPDSGDRLEFTLTQAPAGMTIDDSAGLIAWTPSEGQAGLQTVNLEVTDQQGEADTQSFQVQVQERNYLPVIASEPVITATVGMEYRYPVDATDANTGDPLTFALGEFPEGMIVDPASGLVTWTPITGQENSQSVSVVVSDDRGGSTSQNFQIQVAEENLAPVLLTEALPDATEDQSYRFLLEAADDNTDETLVYSLVAGPSNLQLDAQTGEIAWLPVSTQVGNNPVSIRVTDSRGLFDEVSFNLNVIDVNEPPAIISEPILVAEQGKPYGYQIAAVDPDGNPDLLTYALVEAPVGMALDQNSGALLWTPEASQEGIYEVRVRVQDEAGGFVEQAYGLVVSAANQPPEITSTPTLTVEAGQSYEYVVAVVDDRDTNLVFQKVAGPAGLNVSSGGLVTWAPAESNQGTHLITLRVSDQDGESVEQSFVLTVTVANRNPVIQSSPAASARVEQPYSYTVLATDADGDNLTYDLIQAPAGMSINAASGQVTWTPTESQTGSNNVGVRVTDGQGGSASQNFTLTVSNTNAPPSITSSPSQEASIDELYQYAVSATDPENEPLSFQLTENPQGMTINADSGLVQWQPTDGQTGSFPVTIRVTDAQGAFASQSFAVSVAEQNRVPVLREFRSPLPVWMSLTPIPCRQWTPMAIH
ncbi:MAG: tandem-95 repeat protein [Oleiphilaceae bacterium]|nr:tandem-95 repeat protein [Oleiphilaceae bacterium]